MQSFLVLRKEIRLLMIVGLIAWLLPRSAPATVISYWNFNNSSAYGTTLGALSTTAAAYGEAYNASTLRLAANTGVSGSYSTVYSGSGIYLDLSEFNNGTNANGGFATGAISGWGIFTDSTTDRVSGDTSTGGSLMLSSNTANMTGYYVTLSLSSAGYQSLSLNYAERVTSGTTNSIAWSYSTDGTTWTSLSSPTVTANSTFNATTLSLGSALDNTSSFYLRGTFTFSGPSIALDNISLVGTAIAVPEPGMAALLSLGVCLAGWSLRKNVRLPLRKQASLWHLGAMPPVE